MMKKTIILILNLVLWWPIYGESLSVHYGDLTAPLFKQAVAKSDSTVIIAIGVIEKHGSHLPLNTDDVVVRDIAQRAAKKEYAVVFIPYIFGQINEARHQPGTIAYSPELLWMVLQETCEELGRNGFRKIIILDGHGGNNHFLPYFCQSQLHKKRDYAVILYSPEKYFGTDNDAINKKMTPYASGHGGESETSMMLKLKPELVDKDLAKGVDGTSKGNIEGVKNGYFGIGWYGEYPNHYAGKGEIGQAELGEWTLESMANQFAQFIRDVKANKSILEQQSQFFRESQSPLQTNQKK